MNSNVATRVLSVLNSDNTSSAYFNDVFSYTSIFHNKKTQGSLTFQGDLKLSQLVVIMHVFVWYDCPLTWALRA